MFSESTPINQYCWKIYANASNNVKNPFTQYFPGIIIYLKKLALLRQHLLHLQYPYFRSPLGLNLTIFKLTQRTDALQVTILLTSTVALHVFCQKSTSYLLARAKFIYTWCDLWHFVSNSLYIYCTYEYLLASVDQLSFLSIFLTSQFQCYY